MPFPFQRHSAYKALRLGTLRMVSWRTFRKPRYSWAGSHYGMDYSWLWGSGCLHFPMNIVAKETRLEMVGRKKSRDFLSGSHRSTSSLLSQHSSSMKTKVSICCCAMQTSKLSSVSPTCYQNRAQVPQSSILLQYFLPDWNSGRVWVASTNFPIICTCLVLEILSQLCLYSI